MKVLVAGATGAIGRPLIRCLKESGHAVFGLVRSSVARARRFENSPGVNWRPAGFVGKWQTCQNPTKPTQCYAGAPFSNLDREEEMDTMPLEVWSAFTVIAAGGFLILLGYIISRWRK
jgi:hypothetical protein